MADSSSNAQPQVCETHAQMRALVQQWRTENKTIGLVPTMGNLHDGHLELIKHTQAHADSLVVSIFVNPLQFDRDDDLARYPRTWQQDLDKLQSVGVDAVLYPSVQAMYPKGMDNVTRVCVPELSEILEGEHRPGHFDGVTTVVSKLFHWVQPDVAAFGKKDYQQLKIIQTMVDDLDFPVRLLPIEIQRANTGLALSSRNGLLTDEKREIAANIHQTLKVCKNKLSAGESCDSVEMYGHKQLVNYGLRPEYFVVRRQSDLQPAVPTDAELVILLAAWLDDVRLIDNFEINL